MLQVRPDWSATMTPEKFRKELGIEFDGPGLYLSKTDTVLVVPNRPNNDDYKWTISQGTTAWHHKQPEGTLYDVSVYNVPMFRTVLAWLGNTPCRMDTRGDENQPPIPHITSRMEEQPDGTVHAEEYRTISGTADPVYEVPKALYDRIEQILADRQFIDLGKDGEANDSEVQCALGDWRGLQPKP